METEPDDAAEAEHIIEYLKLMQEELVTVHELWSELSSDQRALLEDHFRLQLLSLPIRAQNLLKNVIPQVASNAETFVAYFADPRHREFKHFRNCGVKTITEILKLGGELLHHSRTKCVGLIDPDAVTQGSEVAWPSLPLVAKSNRVDIEAEHEVPQWSFLSSKHIFAVEAYFASKIGALSSRPIRFLNAIEPPIHHNVFDFMKFFAEPRNRIFKNFLKCGVGTMNKVLELRNDLLRLLRVTEEDEASRKLFDENVRRWNDSFGFPKSQAMRYRYSFIQRKFHLFRFLYNIINNKTSVDRRDLLLMRHRFHYFIGAKSLTLGALGSKLGMTRERVRQIEMNLPSRVQRLMADVGFVHDFIDYDVVNRGRNDLIVIDTQTADAINAHEKVSFSSRFYAFVFALLTNKCEIWIEGELDATTHYLVDNELASRFKFGDFCKDIAERHQKQVDCTYKLESSSYLDVFCISKDHQTFVESHAVCKVLARRIFEIETDADGDFVVQRNTRRRVHEYIEDVLHEVDRPMHVQEIFEVLQNQHPGIVSDSGMVRSHILRYDVFSRYLGASTYGLREWEQTRSDIKAGSFSDIAEEFLRVSAGARHRSDVIDYVLRFRQTTYDNVINTLKMDSYHRFIFLDDGMIDLVDRVTTKRKR